VSIDYEYTTIDVDILMHPKAIAAGIEAMGLWLWAMAWSHKTGANGRIPRHVISMAWGGPPKLVDKLAKRLVSSGLWLATDDGWTIWNYGKKNQSAEEKERKREQGRERVRRLRERMRNAGCNALGNASHARDVTAHGDAPVRDPVLSESRSEDPTGTTAPANDAPPTSPPVWWADALKTVSAEVLGGKPIPDPSALWLEYRSRSLRKRWAMNRDDAVGWLSPVVRRERREAAQRPATGTNGTSAAGRKAFMPKPTGTE